MSEEKKKQDLKEDSEVAAETEEATEGTDGTDEQAPEETLEQQLENAKAEAADLRDKMLRMAADTENFKKRIERERHTMLAYAGENIFREILPVVDNLERAINVGVNKDLDHEQQLVALLEGVQLTSKSLISTLEKFEVKAIDSVGEPFDPKHQEALTMEPSDDVPANHVSTEFEKGYYFKDRLLRAAKVVVSSGKVEEKNEE